MNRLDFMRPIGAGAPVLSAEETIVSSTQFDILVETMFVRNAPYVNNLLGHIATKSISRLELVPNEDAPQNLVRIELTRLDLVDRTVPGLGNGIGRYISVFMQQEHAVGVSHYRSENGLPVVRSDAADVISERQRAQRRTLVGARTHQAMDAANELLARNGMYGQVSNDEIISLGKLIMSPALFPINRP